MMCATLPSNLLEVVFVASDVARLEAAQVRNSHCEVVGGLPLLHEHLHELLHFVARPQDVLGYHLPRNLEKGTLPWKEGVGGGLGGEGAV